jgi:hypothetical protein
MQYYDIKCHEKTLNDKKFVLDVIEKMFKTNTLSINSHSKK